MPVRDGVVAVSIRPARKVKQPTTPMTPAMTPTSAERTGTARVPRPGSTASREPINRAGGRWARNVHSPTGLESVASASPRATRHSAVASAIPITATASARRPRPSTVQSACVPTSRSSRRARPIGNRDDRPRATTSAVHAPTTVVSAAGITNAPAAIRRSAPIARHVARSAAPALTARTKAWPASTTPPRMTARAKSSRPSRSTLVMLVSLESPRSSEPRTTFTGWPISAVTSDWNLPKLDSPWRSTTNMFTMPARRPRYLVKKPLDGTQSVSLSIGLGDPDDVQPRTEVHVAVGDDAGRELRTRAGRDRLTDGHRRTDAQARRASEALVDDDLVGARGVRQPALRRARRPSS